MKKRNLSYFLLVAFVLVMAVLLFQPASAQAYTLTINIDPAAGGNVNVNVNGAGAVPYTTPIAVSNLDYIILDAIPSTASGYVFSGNPRLNCKTSLHE